MSTDLKAERRELSIREFRGDDWAQVWEIIREVRDAGDTYAYDQT